MKFFLFYSTILLSLSSLSAQVYETLPPEYIKTIRFVGAQQEFSGTPIVPLGATLTLTFDDIIGDEANYYYKIKHFNFDWTPSDLSKNEFLNGFDNLRIMNYQNSFGTLQNYTHYELQIPNKNTAGLKVSGNYLLKILNEDDEIVFSRKFIIYESLVNVGVEIKRTRDLNSIDTKQVVQFSVGSDQAVGNSEFIFRNPKRTVQTLVIQNNDLHTAISNLTPQYTIGNKLIYRYDQEASFWGGNEYTSFDSKDLRTSNLNTKRIELIDLYNHYLYPDGVRADKPYTYNPDINGHFKVTSTEGKEDAIEADYINMHFSLYCDKDLQGGSLYLYGNFNNFALNNSTKLTYNSKTEAYEVSKLFKQGYYNYKYILLNENGSVNSGFISGNFDETENQYAVLVYYRELGARYDRIVGIGSANSQNITN